jgi:CO dehydrogenase maturation factor
LKLAVKEKHLVVDRAPKDVDPGFSREIERQGLNLLGIVPEDPFIFEYEMEGKPLLDLPDESPAVQVVDRMMERMMKT